ncbi:AMP-binding protein [Nocardioides sp. zg-536]|uniref:AMP-binding protein n=1 Tax=Nocardioides faecalis TaxID=2803858 RepID=A0A938Y7P2_9ACTN|nr:AMP-binding protein [Nocardioides faecalis]MBM9459375.1 AMP-binding protein [Nocardioides faecalis]QVI60453.1 AMP-binding protein [Nocardioides faecalis]
MPPTTTPSTSRLPDGTALTRLADIVRARAQVSPTARAMTTAAGAATFAELDELSSRIAHRLVSEGVRPGDRVAYIGRNSPEFLAVLYGAAKAGAVATAVNVLLAPAEVTWILDDAAPRAVFLGAEDQHHRPAVQASTARPLVVSAAPEDLTAWTADVPATDPAADGGGDEPALILYSSGTTGNPKGVVLSGHNMARALAAVQDLLELDDTSVAMAPIPFFHISGLGLALVATLVGAELITFTPAGPEDLVATLRERRVSHAVVVPTVLQRLVEMPQSQEPGAWEHLRYVIYGAAPMPTPLLRRAIDVLGCKFVQSYGLTESSGGVTILTHEDHLAGLERPHLLTSCGRALGSVRLRVVDPVLGSDVAPGERGEIWIGGDHVMSGYWRNAEATDAAMSGAWLRTGDIGVLDAEGYLYVVDRLKDMLVSGGENVYPAEVERVLVEHPDVAECAVVAMPSPTWGEVPAALVVRRPGSAVDADALVAWARERMAHFKCPKVVEFTDQLPRNASGKVLKRAIRIAPVPTA